MMKLLVDSGEFMDALAADLDAANSSALAQMMTFEGDLAGLRFANLLIRSSCSDRRLIVDGYSQHMSSCRRTHAIALARDAELRNEVNATAVTYEAMRRAGVRVRFCNPAGRFLRRFPARNHKKIVVVDGRVSYLGGLNISDHNFDWHDLMLRIENPAVARFLGDDVEATWRSRSSPRWDAFDGIAIGTLDGRQNARGFEPVFDALASARDDIVIETPYLTFPFTDRLGDARRRGVRVRVIAPAAHSCAAYLPYLEWECARYGFELLFVPGMTHVKAMLIDGRRLVMGSSNFDYLSYRILGEIVAIVDDAAVVADFRKRVERVDLVRAVPAQRRTHGPFAGFRRYVMEIGGAVLTRVSAS